jgi:hypothetical protein
MKGSKWVAGAGASAIVLAVAIAQASTPWSLAIDTNNSSVRIGNKTFNVSPGTLVATLDQPGDGDPGPPCAIAIDSSQSNPTFGSILIYSSDDQSVQIYGRLQFCDDATGALQDTSSGPTNMRFPNVGFKVLLSGSVPNGCVVPCTMIDLNSDNTQDVNAADYDSSSGTVTLADNKFAAGSSVCGVATQLVNDALGLPSAAGNNEAVFALQTQGAFPACTP